jgi:hypothetical protein
MRLVLGKDAQYILRHPIRAAVGVLSNPMETWALLQDRLAAQREEPTRPELYKADGDWEVRLHGLLDVPWPCEANSEFLALWPNVIREIETKGIRVGPMSFKAWNDGDAGLVRAIWCLVRHLKPATVVETGVAHGFTSRFILEALERNGHGHLWSIDRPPLEHMWHDQIGIAVTDRCRHRWTYIKGSSRRKLLPLLHQLGTIDLFIHDSLHSERNVRFEVEQAWARLRPGGAIVVDDIDANRGFRTFIETFHNHSSMICEAEPLCPDPRRFNEKGLFGVISKQTPILANH